MNEEPIRYFIEFDVQETDFHTGKRVTIHQAWGVCGGELEAQKTYRNLELNPMVSNLEMRKAEGLYE